MTRRFELLPAIDLRGGRVVRLRQGDFDRETSYSNDPVAIAVEFAAAGAEWLHVVDLDGARSGMPVHAATVAEVVAAVGGEVRVETAGGLRTRETVQLALVSGAARVVLGTAALRDPLFAAAVVMEHGTERVAAAIDVRAGRASGDGWDSTAPTWEPLDAISRLADSGITTFEVTAIDRDGLLQGPDLDLLGRAVALDRGHIIASAGIASVEDIAAVQRIGCSGAIVGRALYEGQLTMRDALAASDAG